MKTFEILTAGALALTLAAPASAQILLESVDVNRDGKLTGAEFRNLFDNVVSFSSVDTNGDGSLDEAELEAAFGSKNVQFAELGIAEFTYTDWDLNADGLVSEEEYDTGLLTVYDTDGSGDVSGAEMDRVNSDFGEGGAMGG